MAKTPIVRQASLLGSIPNLAVLALFTIVAFYFSRESGLLLGPATFLALRLVLRAIPRDHRTGIGMVRRQEFSDAIPHFLRSFEFFDNHKWLDDYRAFFLLSSSAVCYREMALANTGFCYSQTGDGANARKYYSQCIEHFPDSLLASTALKMINAGARDA